MLRKLIFSALLLTGLITSGCAANVSKAKEPKPGTLVSLHGDTLFTQAERTCVEEAGKQWGLQTGGVASIQFDWDYDSKSPASIAAHKDESTLVRWTSENPEVKALDQEFRNACKEHTDNALEEQLCGGIMLLGLVYGERANKDMGLVMDRLVNPHQCTNVAMHELGHMMGLPHLTGNYENIMFPTMDPSRSNCLKEDDLVTFCYLNRCGNVKMSPCKE